MNIFVSVKEERTYWLVARLNCVVGIKQVESIYIK
jgi:hypothetical protein